jgi:hypothetical protein
VIDLQGRVVKREPLAQELLQLAADLVAAGQGPDQHIRGQGREPAGDQPDVHVMAETTPGWLVMAVMISPGACRCPQRRDRRFRAPRAAPESRAAGHAQRCCLATWQTTLVEWRHSLVRGDRFSYVARWSTQDQAARFEPVTETG